MRIFDNLALLSSSLLSTSTSSMKQMRVIQSDDVASLPLTSKIPPLQKGKRRIFLIRHGETDFNAAGRLQGGGYDLTLNESGQKQAKIVAEELMDIPFAVIASSHLQRAKQTADFIHQHHKGAERLEFPGLGEMRFGRFEGMALRGPGCNKEVTVDFQSYNNRMKMDASVTWPEGGESLEQVEKRACRALQTILASTSSEKGTGHIGIVAHGRTINIMLASLLRQDARLFSKFHQRNCSVNVLDVCSEGLHFEDILLNYIDHIDHPTHPTLS